MTTELDAKRQPITEAKIKEYDFTDLVNEILKGQTIVELRCGKNPKLHKELRSLINFIKSNNIQYKDSVSSVLREYCKQHENTHCDCHKPDWYINSTTYLEVTEVSRIKDFFRQVVIEQLENLNMPRIEGYPYDSFLPKPETIINRALTTKDSYKDIYALKFDILNEAYTLVQNLEPKNSNFSAIGDQQNSKGVKICHENIIQTLNNISFLELIKKVINSKLKENLEKALYYYHNLILCWISYLDVIHILSTPVPSDTLNNDKFYKHIHEIVKRFSEIKITLSNLKKGENVYEINEKFFTDSKAPKLNPIPSTKNSNIIFTKEGLINDYSILEQYIKLDEDVKQLNEQDGEHIVIINSIIKKLEKSYPKGTLLYLNNQSSCSNPEYKLLEYATEYKNYIESDKANNNPIQEVYCAFEYEIKGKLTWNKKAKNIEVSILNHNRCFEKIDIKTYEEGDNFFSNFLENNSLECSLEREEELEDIKRWTMWGIKLSNEWRLRSLSVVSKCIRDIVRDLFYFDVIAKDTRGRKFIFLSIYDAIKSEISFAQEDEEKILDQMQQILEMHYSDKKPHKKFTTSQLKDMNKYILQLGWKKTITKDENIEQLKELSKYLNPVIEKMQKCLGCYDVNNITEYWFEQVKQCIDNYNITDNQLLNGFSFDDEYQTEQEKLVNMYVSGRNISNEIKIIKQYYIILKLLNAIGNFGEDKIFPEVIEYIKEIEKCCLVQQGSTIIQ